MEIPLEQAYWNRNHIPIHATCLQKSKLIKYAICLNGASFHACRYLVTALKQCPNDLTAGQQIKTAK